jgi:hypothetical protein
MTAHNPTLLADSMAEIIQHMNADHKDALVLLAQAFARIDSQEATMIAVDRLGFHVRLWAQTSTEHPPCISSARLNRKAECGDFYGEFATRSSGLRTR